MSTSSNRSARQADLRVCDAGGFAAGAVEAQIVAATLPVGSQPKAMAINPVANKIYAANFAAGTVTVIDGATHGMATVTVGSQPAAVAVNSTTNKIYVAPRLYSSEWHHQGREERRNGDPGCLDPTIPPFFLRFPHSAPEDCFPPDAQAYEVSLAIATSRR